jgi:hypothetical protein
MEADFWNGHLCFLCGLGVLSAQILSIRADLLK